MGRKYYTASAEEKDQIEIAIAATLENTEIVHFACIYGSFTHRYAIS